MKRLLAIILSVSITLFQAMPVLSEPVFLSDNDLDNIVAGYTEENTATLTGDSQRELHGLSNVNDVDSAVTVQSNITCGGGVDIGSYNYTRALNIDSDTSEPITVDNTLTINEQAQMELKAFSNVNSVDSAVAVQSNLTIGSPYPWSENHADVDNIDGDSDSNILSGNYLTLAGHAQAMLCALSNLNSVDSAVAVQSNGNIGGYSVNNFNYADVDNFNGDSGDVDTLDDLPHSLSITEHAQEGLMAYSNVNAVDSAVCVQLNTSLNIENDANNTNDGYATNNSTTESNYMDSDNELYITDNGQAGTNGIVNINAVDSAELAQVNITVFSGTVGVTDSNYVRTVLNDDGQSSGTAWGTDTNNMYLLGNAQQGLVSLHSENLVDSATTIEGNYGAFGGMDFRFNEAYLTNNDKDAYINSSANSMLLSVNAQQGLKAVSNLNAVDSASGVQTNFTHQSSIVVEDNYAEVTNNDGTSQSWAEVDNDLTMAGNSQQNLEALTNTNSVDSASMVQANLVNLADSESTSVNNAVILNTDGTAGGSSSGETDNLLHLYGNAQEGLIAESNLNEVDSATLVQTNITIETETGTDSELISTNVAVVDNVDISGEDNGVIISNRLLLDGNTQRSLQALSNINSVDSASAVQTNLTVNGEPSLEPGYAYLIDTASIEVDPNCAVNLLIPLPATGELIGWCCCGMEDLEIPVDVEVIDVPHLCENGVTIEYPIVLGVYPDGLSETGDTIACFNAAIVTNSDGTSDSIDAVLSPDDVLNLLNLSGESQSSLSALSNLNTVDSASAVQSNIVYANGATLIVDPYTFHTPLYYGNYALVLNDNGSTGTLYNDTDKLTLSANTQADLTALSNLNTVDSANAVQTNIASAAKAAPGVGQNNQAYVTNQPLVITGQRQADPINILTSSGTSQMGLTALSNLNTVSSANAVQANYTITSNIMVNYNYAEVSNSNSSSSLGFTQENDIILDYSAQSELTALSNMNSVDSANAAQFNINSNGTEIISWNIAEVVNTDGAVTSSGNPVQENHLTLLLDSQKALTAISNLNTVDSANAVQVNISSVDDTAIESVNDALVSNIDGDTNNGNAMLQDDSMELYGNSQKELNALSNLNTVDSANAVQVNIGMAQGDSSYNSATNMATVENVDSSTRFNANGNPRQDNYLGLYDESQRLLSALSNLNTVDSANAVQANILTSQGNYFDTYASNDATVTNTDGEGKHITQNNTLHLDPSAQRELNAMTNLNSVDSANSVQINVLHLTGSNLSASSSNSSTVSNIDGSTRATFDADIYTTNYLPLEDTNQMSLTALSNINAIDSASTAQINTVALLGTLAPATLTNINIATVENIDGSVSTREDPPRPTSSTITDTDNELSISGQSQSGLSAMSNLNTVDSANAAQFNVTCLGAVETTGSVINSNTAEVTNTDGTAGDTALNKEVYANNTISIMGSAQSAMCGLSSINTVDSANAVQMNMTFGGDPVTNTNTATVSNLDASKDGEEELIREVLNSLGISGTAQISMSVLSNLNSVDSANAVQSNVSKGSNITSTNSAGVINGPLI